MLPFLAVGESTTVAPSPPKPSSEDAVPGTEMLCLRVVLVGMLRKPPKALLRPYLGVCPMLWVTKDPTLALAPRLEARMGARGAKRLAET